jgi:hypothetical protein
VGAPAAEMLPQKRCRLRPSSFPPQRRRWSCTREPRCPPGDREDAKAREESDLEAARAKAERAAEASGRRRRRRRRSWRRTTGSPSPAMRRRDPRGSAGGARRPARDTTARERARKARQGQGQGRQEDRRSGDKSHTRKRRAA